MKKPIIAAAAAFCGWAGTSLAISYFKHGDPAWIQGLGGGLVFAFASYAIAQWKQQRAESKSFDSGEH